MIIIGYIFIYRLHETYRIIVIGWSCLAEGLSKSGCLARVSGSCAWKTTLLRVELHVPLKVTNLNNTQIKLFYFDTLNTRNYKKGCIIAVVLANWAQEVGL